MRSLLPSTPRYCTASQKDCTLLDSSCLSHFRSGVMSVSINSVRSAAFAVSRCDSPHHCVPSPCSNVGLSLCCSSCLLVVSETRMLMASSLVLSAVMPHMRTPSTSCTRSSHRYLPPLLRLHSSSNGRQQLRSCSWSQLSLRVSPNVPSTKDSTTICK